jgi:hypothetical protein
MSDQQAMLRPSARCRAVPIALGASQFEPKPPLGYCRGFGCYCPKADPAVSSKLVLIAPARFG